AFLPEIYGTVELKRKNKKGKLKTEPYMVMENLRYGNEQLADIKLAGNVDGLYNPICSPPELRATRRKDKKGLNASGMKESIKYAPNYILTVASGKVKRQRTYPHSEEYLW